jgi:pimeloyl-ACP methyl ester carboxylesterase
VNEMATGNSNNRPGRKPVEVPGGVLDVTEGPVLPGAPIVCAAHPAGVFAESAVDLLREITGASVVCVNPRGIGQSSPVPSGTRYTFDSMVDDLDAVRQRLGVRSWVFWGMSGGGWLGQAYACRHSGALGGVILESICSCFRVRLADPTCILSPFHASWRVALERRGLIDPDSHADVGDASATEWLEVGGVGPVFRRRGGPALLVSPTPVSAEMRTAMPLLWPADFRESLRVIRTPTLVIGGSADPIVPLAHVQSLHDGIAGSRLLIVEGGGHVPTTARHSQVIDAARSFLRDCVK